ncbi:hypothetical protein [uncultured Bradyrhizobium sp.]|uniref:hypothetical protein n=1 Tax=uncultured Bradyrhizobium sp. TaxID=199684 RepID=UPI002621A349|nr:hypothetical protein [uncultured Bradyrhizobium sp.]
MAQGAKVALIGDSLAVPIYDNGAFIDVLLVDDAFDTETVAGRAVWLGTIPCRKPVRLHARPVDWLEAGCTGVCHIALVSRDGLRQLRKARVIECNDIGAALEAWDFGFGGDERKLGRFEIDDVPSSIAEYVDVNARVQAWGVLSRAT